MDAEAVEGYLAERFSDKGSTITRIAGDELLRLASAERDAGALARSIQLYDMFFEYYPTHYNAAVQAFSLGARAVKQEDWELAARFYGHIANLYTNHTSYASALHSLSVCYDKMGNDAEYEKWLRLFADTTKKLPERTGSKLILAQRQQKDGFALFDKAAETNDVEAADLINKDAYRRVAGAIRDFRSVSSEIDKALKEGKIENKKEKDSLSLRCEQAMFLEADSWARMKWPADKVSSFRKAAVNAYEKYIAAFPKGQYAAPVMVKIGTIWTAEKDMEKSQDAFKRLQENYPDSDEAKNSVPRLAKTLIDMGLKAEGVAQYRQMLATPGGKYTAGQFLLAGDALLEAKSWDTAQEAYMKAADLVKGNTNMVVITMRAQMGKAKALFGAERYAESHEALDSFIEKYSKSKLVVDAYTMLVDVASHEGRKEKDDTLRMKYFNQAVAAIKKLRNYKKTKAEQDVLDLESADILVRKMEAEESMNLQAQAKETCGKAVASFQVFLMANEPTEEYPFKDMTAAQRRNLERCYASVLPLMAKMGKDQAENTIKYANMYLELFPDGKNKTAVQNALNQAKAE
jgi:tetratricopeptide (TPR) repeat protein